MRQACSNSCAAKSPAGGFPTKSCKIEAMPLAATGKIDKNQLRADYANGKLIARDATVSAERLTWLTGCRKSQAPTAQQGATARRKLEQILDAAEYLFSKHGLHGVTLRDVAQRVGIHTTLLHYYFKDKRNLFEAVFARRAGVTSDRRIAALERYEAEAGDHPTVEGALHAFLDTDLDLYYRGRRSVDELRRLLRPRQQHPRRGGADGRPLRSGGAEARQHLEARPA